MSLPAQALDGRGRADICAFYGEVFGWEELPTETVDRKQLVMSAYRHDQFVFLIADDTPMAAPRLDHFGMGVDALDELDDFLAKARTYKDKDDRVDIIDKEAHDHGGLVLTSFYVGYLLPMMVEVQHFDWQTAS